MHLYGTGLEHTAGVDHVKQAGLHGAGRQNRCWQPCHTAPPGMGNSPLCSSESVLKSYLLPFSSDALVQAVADM